MHGIAHMFQQLKAGLVTYSAMALTMLQRLLQHGVRIGQMILFALHTFSQSAPIQWSINRLVALYRTIVAWLIRVVPMLVAQALGLLGQLHQIIAHKIRQLVLKLQNKGH
jgi:hypothetical protein